AARAVGNAFPLPAGVQCENLAGTGAAFVHDDAEGSGLAAYVASLFDPALSLAGLEWLTSITRLPVVGKGIVHPDDARLAAEHGAPAVIVSNHGGRQLDTAVAT